MHVPYEYYARKIVEVYNVSWGVEYRSSRYCVVADLQELTLNKYKVTVLVVWIKLGIAIE
jgi:hypothetical protein